MIRLKLSKSKFFKERLVKLSKGQRIVAVIFGAAVMIFGGIFVLAELGGYGVNGPATAPNSLDFGLVGYWNMEEGSGQTVKDKSGNGNDGTLGASTAVGTDDPVFAQGFNSNGAEGTGMQFDGVDDYVGAGNGASLQLSTAFTIGAWVKTSATTNNFVIKAADTTHRSYELYTASGEPRLLVSGDGSTTAYTNSASSTINDGNWHYITGVYTGSALLIYKDGVPLSFTLSGSVPASLYNTSGTLQIGRYPSPASYTAAILDEVRIYNRALSVDEIRMLYNQKKPILQYKFDEGSGTIAYNEGSGDYLSSWQYRKSVIVTNGLASPLTDYQVKLTIDTAALAGKMKPDGSDLRFIDTSGNNIPYWIESGINTSSTIIWIKTDLASSETKTVYMYYGNSAASAASNGNVVFNLFDDFSVADTSKWTFPSGNYDITDGVAHVYATNSEDKSIGSIGSFGNNTVVRASIKTAHNAATTGIYERPIGFGSATQEVFFSSVETSSYGPSLVNSGAVVGVTGWSANTFYASELKRANTQSEFMFSGGTTINSATSPTDNETIRIRAISVSATQAQVWCDWVAIRQYVTTEPSSGAWSAEEKLLSDLALVNSPVWVTGKFGTALNLTAASSQYGYTSDNASISLTGNLTMGAWIKPTSITASTLFDIGGKWDGTNESYLLAQYGDEIRMYIDSSSSYKTTNAANLSAGTWYHVEAVYTAASQTVDIYVNGVLQAGTVTGTIPTAIGDDAGRFQIGAEDTTTTPANFYDGVIDNFNLYSYARTANEVLTDYSDNQAAHLGKNDQDLNRGLVGYWNMEEGGGQTVADRSGNGNTGTLGASTSVGTDDPVFAPGFNSNGAEGTGLSFNGSSQYIGVSSISNIPTGQQARTVSFWVNPTALATDSNSSIVSIGDSGTGQKYLLQLAKFGGIYYLFTDAENVDNNITIIGDQIPAIGDWSNISFVFDGNSSWAYYLNGVSKKSGTFAGPAINTSATDISIGRRNGGGYFNGSIDEVRIYNRALSADEIELLYNQKKPILQYKFDEGSGTTAKDESFNNNDLTLVNTPTWVTGKFGTGLDLESSSSQYGYLADNANISLTGNLTLGAWIKPESVTASTLFDIGGKWDGANESYLLAQYEDEIRVYIDSSSSYKTTDSANLAAGTWYHVEAVYTAASQTVDIYINGILQAGTVQGTIPTSIGDDAGRFQLGAEDTSPSNFYDGIIDEFKLYNYARTADEALADLNNGQAAHLGSNNQNNWYSTDKKHEWQYRKPITVTNQVASALTDYQVKLTIDTAALYSAGKMKIDGSDLRFADVNGVDIPYWIESGINTSSTIIWIKTDLASSEAKTVYMYYGNSGASAVSNGNNVFDFFDDFDGSVLDSSRWSVVYSNGSATTLNGILTMTGGSSGGSWREIKSAYLMSQSHTITFKAKYYGEYNGGYGSFIGARASGDTSYFDLLYYDVLNAFRTSVGANYNPVTTNIDTNVNTYELKWSSNNLSVAKNGVAMTGSPTTLYVPTENQNLEIASAGGTSYRLDVYYIFVRAYAATEPTSSVGAEETMPALVLNLKMDEGSGTTAKDESFNNNDLTLVNTPSWVTGKFATALDFESGSSQYGYLADNASISLTGNLTMAAWIKPTSVTSSTLFDIGGKWDGTNESYLLAQYGDEIRMYIDVAGSYKTTNSANLSAGTWYHVEAVYNAISQTVDIYINGILQAGTVTGTIPASIGDDTGRFQLGAEDTTATNFYDGVIDEFRLYNYTRTTGQVLVDYNNGLAAHLR